MSVLGVGAAFLVTGDSFEMTTFVRLKQVETVVIMKQTRFTRNDDVCTANTFVFLRTRRVEYPLLETIHKTNI